MGRKTWDSIPAKFRPLPGRLNVVLTRNATLTGAQANDENGMIEVFGDLEMALMSLARNQKVNEVFIIGGASIYE